MVAGEWVVPGIDLKCAMLIQSYKLLLNIKLKEQSMTEETKPKKIITEFPVSNTMLEEVIIKLSLTNSGVEKDLQNADDDYAFVIKEHHKRIKQSTEMYAQTPPPISEIKRNFLTPEDLAEERSACEDILKWKSFGEKELIKNNNLIKKLKELHTNSINSLLLQKAESAKVLKVLKYSIDKIKVPDKYKYYPATKEKAENKIKEIKNKYKHLLTITDSNAYIKLIKD